MNMEAGTNCSVEEEERKKSCSHFNVVSFSYVTNSKCYANNYDRPRNNSIIIINKMVNSLRYFIQTPFTSLNPMAAGMIA